MTGMEVFVIQNVWDVSQHCNAAPVPNIIWHNESGFQNIHAPIAAIVDIVARLADDGCLNICSCCKAVLKCNNDIGFDLAGLEHPSNHADIVLHSITALQQHCLFCSSGSGVIFGIRFLCNSDCPIHGLGKA
jgi:hypothetical protein